MANKETPLINWEILIAALVTAWESEGYVVGTGTYIQLNTLFKQLPDTISAPQLKTLIAPIITQNAKQQDEFYRLFDSISQQVIEANQSHKAVVKNEEKNIIIKNIKYKATHFLNKNSQLIDSRFAKIIGITTALCVVGLLVFGYFYRLKTYKDLKDTADVGEYKRFCLSLNTGDSLVNYTQKTGTIQVFNVEKINRNLCIDYVPQLLGKEELTIFIKLNNGLTESFIVYISSFKIRNIVYAPPPRGIKTKVTQYKPQLKTHKDSLNAFANINDEATEKEKVGGQYIEGISSTWEFGFGNSYFTTEKALIVLLALILVALVGYFWQYKSQKFTLKFSADTNLPSSWGIRIPNSGNVLMDEKFYLAVSEMRKREIHESRRIDVKKTITRSIANGGMIEFNYLQDFNAKNYLVLLDINSDDNHRSKLNEFIIKSLYNHDVPIICFYFKEDSQLCWNENVPRGTTISELRHKYADYQLIVFSTGEELINPNSGALYQWTSIFDGWRKKIILTPRLATDWDNQEDILSKKFRILPATTEGLAALVETLEAVEPKNYTLWKERKTKEKPIDIPADMDAEDLYILLESEFIYYKNRVKDDRLLRWIAASALPPVPFWDWTLYVGELLNESGNACLTLNNLFTISQINWFIEGKIPNNYRGLLIKWLENNHPYFLTALINDWSHILKLETNLPPTGSLAWQNHRVQVLLNDLLKQTNKHERHQLELELDNLIEGETVNDALVVHYLDGRTSLLDNMLSNNFRKFIQTKKSILWKWRDWTWQLPIVLLVALMTLFIHYSEPVTSFNFNHTITALNFMPDNKAFLVANKEGKIGICDDNRWIQSVNSKFNIIDLTATTINNEPIISAANNIGDLMLWNQYQGNSEYKVVTDIKNVNCATISLDLKQLIVGYYTTNNAQLWDIEKHTFISFLGHTDAITDVKMSHDQKYIITASRDNTAKLWTIDGRLLQTYIGHSGTVYSIDISPDDTKILTGSRDNTAKLWNRETGKLLQTFEGHDYDVFDARFSPDGQSIVTASGDKTAKLWSINGDLKRTFYGHNDYVKKAIFSPDNKQILTGDNEGKVKLWQLK